MRARVRKWNLGLENGELGLENGKLGLKTGTGFRKRRFRVENRKQVRKWKNRVGKLGNMDCEVEIIIMK